MPFVMQPINTRVVRRSNALLGNLYGMGLPTSMHAPAAAYSWVSRPSTDQPSDAQPARSV